MSNIVWQRPDGSLAVTVLAPKALSRMQWANANQAKLEDKITLAAERAALAVAIDFAGEDHAELVAARDTLQATAASAAKAEDAAALDQAAADLSAIAPRIATVEAAMAAKQADLKAIDERLAEIADIERVRDTMGLDEHGHELLLLARGDIPADHLCMGHALELPADGTYFEAWRFVGGAIVVDAQKKKAIDAAGIKRQLDALDEASRTTRPSRDLVLLQAAQLPGAAKKAQVVEATAAVLRAQLAALG